MGDLGPGTCAEYDVGHVGTSWDVLRYNWDLGLVLGTMWDTLGHLGMS